MGYTRVVVELGRLLFGLTYIGGAVVHLVYWTSNRGIYANITPYILFDWYRALWTGLVLPNLRILLPVLAIVEVVIGTAILSRERYVKCGLGLGVLFNLCVAPLGFWWPANLVLATGHLALLRFGYPATVLERARMLAASDPINS